MDFYLSQKGLFVRPSKDTLPCSGIALLLGIICGRNGAYPCKRLVLLDTPAKRSSASGVQGDCYNCQRPILLVRIARHWRIQRLGKGSASLRAGSN